MTELIQKNDWKYESSLDNVTEELLWVKNQIKKELTNLQQDIQEDQIKESFFDRQWENVEYHMDLVKEYLQYCIQNENFQVNSAVVMAVQIALESLEKEEYDVWKIDGLLTRSSWKTSKTQKAIRQFQKDNKIHVDWFPWKETIQKVLDILWDEESQNIPATPEVEEDNSVPEDDDTSRWTDNAETTKSIKIKLDKDGNVSNLQEILDARNLDLPQLQAWDVSELWWFWNSVMKWFQWYWENSDKHFRFMIWMDNRTTQTHSRSFKSEEDVVRYKDQNPNLKSFVMYFDWEDSDNSHTLQDLSNWAERLNNNWIEPVLCTCVGNVPEWFNNKIRNIYEQNKDKWYKLIDFAKINDLVEIKDENGGILSWFSNYFKSWKYNQSYALMHDIVYKCIEK